MQKSNKIGQVIIPANAHPWPHEERVAKILAGAGYRVEFIPEGRLKTADILLDGVEFEIKSPTSSKIKAVQRNLVKGLSQSCNIVFDGSRMKHVRDDQITKQLVSRLRIGKGLKRIIFISKRGQIVDINELS